MLKKFLQKYPLISFITLSYALAWAIWLPWIYFNQSDLSIVSARWYIYAGTFAPSVSAIIIWLVEGKKYEAARTLKSIFKIPKQTLLASIYFLFPLAVFIGLNLANLVFTGAILDEVTILGNLVSILKLPLTLLIVVLLFAGPLGEELGWRSFMLPRLLSKYSITKSSIIIGIVWSFWHLPLFFFESWRIGVNPVIYLPLYTTGLIFISTFLTKIWVESKQSLFAVILFHAAFNYLVSRYSVVFEDLSSLQFMSGLLATFVVVNFLTRKSFSFKLGLNGRS